MIDMPSVPALIHPEESALAAAIHAPNAPTGKLAVLCPGFVDSKDYAHLVALAGELADRGYTAVRFDPTGTWASVANIELYTVTQYLEDVQSVIDHMCSTSTYTEILIAGHSMGGFVAMLYAARDSRITCVVDIMGAYSFARPANATIIDAWKISGVRTVSRDVPGTSDRREVIVPYTHVIDRLQYHVLEEISAVHAPIVLIAGEKDDIVVPEEVAKIYERANQPKRFVTIPGIGHDYRHNPDEIEIVNQHVFNALATLH